MAINRILEDLSKVPDFGDRVQKQSPTITPTVVLSSETTLVEKRGEQQFYGNYQRNKIEGRWAHQQQQPQTQRTAPPVPRPHPTPTPQPNATVNKTQQIQPTETVQSTTPAQDGNYPEVTLDQLRAVMPYSWQARKPRITDKTPPQMREKLIQRYERKQALLDVKLEDYRKRLNETMKKFEINTPLKQAMFLATVAQESGEMRLLTEQPSKYASSRDPYKGRGIIQITHEDNYRAASEYLGLGDLFVKKPELVATPEYAFPTAGWFWSVRKSGQYHETPNSRIGDAVGADLMDFREAAGLVNGGQRDRLINHWGTRLEYYQRALKALNIPISEDMQQNLNEQIEEYQGKNHLRAPEQSWWDSPAGKTDKLRKKYGIK